MSDPVKSPTPKRATTALNTLGDGVLIELYRSERDQDAMRTLVERHHDPIYRHFRRELFDEADAEVCSQRLWIQVTRQLDDYPDEGDFPGFLWTLAIDVIDEFRQRTSTGPAMDGPEKNTDDEPARTDGPDNAQALDGTPADGELVDRLVRELIPALPVEQRAAWLLRHESESRVPGRRLEWTHLAELNGIDVRDAWALFESARGRLVGGARSASSTVLDEEEMLVFLVWTQAQRATRTERFAWDYLAELVGVPVSTMQARYRAAESRLAAALEHYRKQ